MAEPLITREGDKPEADIYSFLKRRNGYIRKGKVQFVGCCRFDKGDTVIYSLPKYCPDSMLTDVKAAREYMTLVCRVIERIRSRTDALDDDEVDSVFDVTVPHEKRKRVDKYALSEYILRDYIIHGLYVKKDIEKQRAGRGKTLWGATVRRCAPIIDRGTVIYPDTVNRRVIDDPSDIMTMLHAAAVNRSAKFLSGISDIRVEPVRTAAELGDDLSGYCGLIARRSASVFEERTLNLFRALEAFCGATRYYREDSGTTVFHRVWERTNDYVWGTPGKWESGNPRYHFKEREPLNGKGDQIPDTVHIIKRNEHAEKIHIFDSKYYAPKENGNGLPANSDIVKQISYYMFIRKEAGGDALIRSNSFLFPMNDGFRALARGHIPNGKNWYSHAGYVRRGEFVQFRGKTADDASDNDFDNLEKWVGMIIVEPEQLYRRYLKGEPIEPDELTALFNDGEVEEKNDSILSDSAVSVDNTVGNVPVAVE